MPATLGLLLRPVAKLNQRIVALARTQHDVAAARAIAAAGPASRNEFFAPEGNAAVAAVAGFHANGGFINEHVVRPNWKAFR